MRKPVLIALIALLVACEDQNDERIATFKKCQAAGMETSEGITALGVMKLYCTQKKAKP